MNFSIEYAVILTFHDLYLRGQQMWHMYFVLKHPFRQDIFKQTYQNVMFRDYILTLYTIHIREFKHMCYQIY